MTKNKKNKNFKIHNVKKKMKKFDLISINFESSKSSFKKFLSYISKRLKNNEIMPTKPDFE